MIKYIYADNAATTEISSKAMCAMLPYLMGTYGNPSSAHYYGRKADKAVSEARASIAQSIGAKSEKEIIFTSGGTEADNQALRTGAWYGQQIKKQHIITTQFEHHAVLNTVKWLEQQGCSVTYLPVHEDGIVRVKDVEKAIRSNTVMVSVMMVNNEVGTIQPIAEIGALCRKRRIIFHTDAVQAVGHIPVNVEEMNIDMLSMSGHKFHGPKGVGALYVRENCPVLKVMEGGEQESGRRGGTENVAGIVGMAEALKESCEHMVENTVNVTRMRTLLMEGILGKIPKCQINGDPLRRVPGNLSVCFEGIEGAALVMRLDSEKICISEGSACTTGTLEPSHVLRAMGVPDNLIGGAVRITLNECNSMTQVRTILESLIRNVEALRRMSDMWTV